jgi:hypothetical protein
MTNVAHNLAQSIEDARALLRNFADILTDEDAREIAIESETDLAEMRQVAVARILEVDALVAGIDATMAKLKARKARLEDQADSLRTLLITAMEFTNQTKMELPIATVALRPVPPSVRVTDEAAIPSAYWKPQPPKLDKASLLKALKEKDAPPIPGAELSNGGSTIMIKAS